MSKLKKIEKQLFNAYLRGTGCELTFEQCKKLLSHFNTVEDDLGELEISIILLERANTMYQAAAASWAGVAKRLAEVLKTINDTKHLELVDGRRQVCVNFIPGLDDDLIDAVLKDYETMTAEVKA